METTTQIYNAVSNFTSVKDFIKSVFQWYVTTLDCIYILGNFSMLDFSIALLIMGAVLPLVIKTTGNYAAYGDSASIRNANASKRSQN